MPTPQALSFGETLDTGFTLYRRHFATFFLLALLPRVPEVLYWLILLAVVPAGVRDVGGFLILPWSFFASVLTLGALTYATAEGWEGREPDLVTALRVGLRRWLPLAGAAVLAYLAFFFGLLLLVVPGIFLFVSFFAFAPVVTLEGRGSTEALSRSWALARGGRLRILGVTLVAYLLVLLPSLALGALGFFLVGGSTGFFSDDPGALEGSLVWLDGMIQVAGPVVSALVWPLFVAILVVLYLDRRARVDAPELEDALDRL